MNQIYNRISLSILKESLEQKMSNENWKFSKEVHNRCLELLPHTSDCILHRFNDYFQGQYQFYELNKCQGRFGCDFINYDNVNGLSFVEYNNNLQLNIPCSYENVNYDLQQTNNQEVVLINKEYTWYRPNSIFELIYENIISTNEMKYTLNHSVV